MLSSSHSCCSNELNPALNPKYTTAGEVGYVTCLFPLKLCRFFVLFQLCVSVFFIKLTSAIFINSAFEMAGGGLLTKAQRIWFYIRRTVDSRVDSFLSPAARPPRNWLRLRIFRIVTHPFFESGVTVAILLNLISMLDRGYSDSSVKVYAVDLIDSVFLLLYYVEMVMRLVAIGPKSFAKDFMNLFDLFVNIMSAIDFFSSGQSAAQGFQILRAVRVLRLFKILNRFKRMRLLITSIVKSVPYFLAAMCIAIAFLILCAVVMSEYFHSIKYGVALNAAQNFRGFLPSLTTMFVAFFSGEWANLLPELSVSHPHCTLPSDATKGVTDCGNSSYWVFFLIFQWVCMFFITPLFLGMITCVVFQLNDVDRSSLIAAAFGDSEDELSIIPDSDYNDFFKAWELVDPLHIGLVRAWRIKAVVCHLVGRKISDFAARGSLEWKQRLDFIVYQSVLATNNVKYLKSSSKVKSENDASCGYATQYVHIREVLLQMVMMVRHKCHIDSPLIQYAPWLQNTTDIVSSIASQEVRNVLSDLKDSVEHKGTALLTPTPGQPSKTIYEIMAANIAGGHFSAEDDWLNLKSYNREANMTHRSDVSSASELQEFQEIEEVNDEEEMRRKNAHLAGLDAFDAMINDCKSDGDEESDSKIDWEALLEDESFFDDPLDALPHDESNVDSQQAATAPLLLGEESSTAFENGNPSDAASEHNQPDENHGGFNPLHLCASSRVEICASNRSGGEAGEEVAAGSKGDAGVFGVLQSSNGSARPNSTRSNEANVVEKSEKHPTGSSETDDLFSMPSIFRRCSVLLIRGFPVVVLSVLQFCLSSYAHLQQLIIQRCSSDESESVCFHRIRTKPGHCWPQPLVRYSTVVHHIFLIRNFFPRFEEPEAYLPFIRR